MTAMQKVEHIGIAVGDLESAISRYEKLLDGSCYKRERVDTQKVETAFFQTGETKVELLAATDNESVIAKYIEKNGEGMHHLAFEVEDIQAEMKRLRSEGFTLVSDEPTKGADQKLVVFVHPRDSHGVLVELCQDMRQ
jgi:methylmalonyl-CoA/ethylmalonyl-CoA epimerase